MSGTREYYEVTPTPDKVKIGDVKGWGLYVDLTDMTKESVTRLSDEERARRAEKLRRTLAAKESAPGAEETTEE